MRPNEKSLIYNTIYELEKIIGNSKITYEFKQDSDTHFIVIAPCKGFDPSVYQELYFQSIEDLESINPEHLLCIMHTAPLVELNNPEYLTWEATMEYVEAIESVRLSVALDTPPQNEFNEQMSLAA